MPKTQPKQNAKDLSRAVSVAQERQKQPATKKPTLSTRVGNLESTIERHDRDLKIALDATQIVIEHVDRINHRIDYDMATAEELGMLRDTIAHATQRANDAYRQAVQTDEQVTKWFKSLSPVNFILGSVAISTFVTLFIVFTVLVTLKKQAIAPAPTPPVVAPSVAPTILAPDAINASTRKHPRQSARIATTGK